MNANIKCAIAILVPMLISFMGVVWSGAHSHMYYSEEIKRLEFKVESIENALIDLKKAP